MPSWKKLIVSGSDAALNSLSVSTSVTANSFVKLGGTSSQFLKADGSVDSTVYQPLLTNPVTGTGVAGQVTYWNGTAAITGSANLTYSLGNLTLTGTNGSVVLGSTGDQLSFTRNGPVYISANAGSSAQIYFEVNGAERWRMLASGVWQSNGAQTVQTSTGNLTIATAGGNGNIIITPNGTGFLDSQLRTLLRGYVTVGVNTLTNRGRLHVHSENQTSPTLGNGGAGVSLVVSNSDGNYGTVFFTKSNGQGAIQQMRVDGTATSYSLTLQELGGNVLIGATSDNGHRLQVNGRGTFLNTSDTQISLLSPDTWAGITFADVNSGDQIYFNGVNSTFSIGGPGANVAGKKLHVEGGVTIGAGHRTTSVPTNGLTVEGTVLVGKTVDAGEKFQVNGNALITNALISNQENLDVDSAAAEVVAQISSTTYTAVFFDYSIKNGTNVRSGTVYTTHNGTNVVYTETSTADLGDTSGVELSVDLNGGNIRLLATVTSDNWVIKSLVRGL